MDNQPVGGPARPRRVLEDFSVTQVVASALSAVTSLLLSSQIGIIGGVVGVAVGAAVAAIATQVYKGLINASADKIRCATSDPRQSGEATVSGDAGTGAATNGVASSPDPTTLMPAAGSSTDATALASRVAPDSYLQERGRRRHMTMRRACLAIVLAALGAVALTAFVVMAVTSGKGLGDRIGVLPSPAPATSRPAAQDNDDTGTATTDDGATAGGVTVSQQAGKDQDAGKAEQPAETTEAPATEATDQSGSDEQAPATGDNADASGDNASGGEAGAGQQPGAGAAAGLASTAGASE